MTLCAEVFGLVISEGAVAVARLGAKLVHAAEEVATAVRTALVAGSDETNMRVNEQTLWAWVFQTATAAVFRIRPRRNVHVLVAFLDASSQGRG